MKCLDCGNTQEFITERWYLHWVKVDGDGAVTQVDDRQSDESSHLDISGREYIECGECNFTNVDEEV